MEAEPWTEYVNGQGFTVKRLKDRKPGESWVLLYYGPSGSGKTFFCGTAGSRSLYLNIGTGIETLMSPAFTKLYGKVSENMITVDITEDKNADAEWAFDQVCQAIAYFVNKHRDQFDTVIVDDATFLRRMALNKGLDLNKSDKRKERSEKIDKMEFVISEPGDTFREMGLIEWFLAQTIPQLKAEGINFVLTAHDRNIYAPVSKQEGGGYGERKLIRTLPGFSGQTFPDQVPAYFDDVFRAEVIGGGEQRFYRCRTAGDEERVGKARHGDVFSPVIVNPNFRLMLKQIRDSQQTR